MKEVTAYIDNHTRQWVRSTGEWVPTVLSPQLTFGESTLLKLTILNPPPLDETWEYQAFLTKYLNQSSPEILDISTSVNLAEDWDEADEEEGKFAIRLGLNTAELRDALDTLIKDTYWLTFSAVHEGVIVYSLATPIWVWNSIGSEAGVTPIGTTMIFRNLPVTQGASQVVVSSLDGRAMTATLEAPTGGFMNIGVSNVEVNAERTQATVFLTASVPTTGYILRCILYKV